MCLLRMGQLFMTMEMWMVTSHRCLQIVSDSWASSLWSAISFQRAYAPFTLATKSDWHVSPTKILSDDMSADNIGHCEQRTRVKHVFRPWLGLGPTRDAFFGNVSSRFWVLWKSRPSPGLELQRLVNIAAFCAFKTEQDRVDSPVKHLHIVSYRIVVSVADGAFHEALVWNGSAIKDDIGLGHGRAAGDTQVRRCQVLFRPTGICRQFSRILHWLFSLAVSLWLCDFTMHLQCWLVVRKSIQNLKYSLVFLVNYCKPKASILENVSK